MQAIEIAGHKVRYKNIADLEDKVAVMLEQTRNRRSTHVKALASIRKEEKSLMKFLGKKDRPGSGPKTDA